MDWSWPRAPSNGAGTCVLQSFQFAHEVLADVDHRQSVVDNREDETLVQHYKVALLCLPTRHGAIRLQHKCNRLRLLATYSITIALTNKQNHNVIEYDYIESNHDYNCDYICRETPSGRKQNTFAWFDVSIFRQYKLHSVMLEYNNAEPSHWLHDIYWHWMFLLWFRFDFCPWFVTSSVVGSFTLWLFLSFQQNTDFLKLIGLFSNVFGRPVARI